MDKKRYIIFNSIARCGNTFLQNCFYEAVALNFDHYSLAIGKHFEIRTHQHNPLLLRIPKEDKTIIQFTTFRHPIEQIPSLFALRHHREALKNKDILNGTIIRAIEEYQEWVSFYLETKNSNIILFEDIKNDINKVMKEMFDSLSIDFIRNIDSQAVKDTMHIKEENYFETEEEKFLMGRLPRGFNETPEYFEIQNLLITNKWIKYNYSKLLDDYNKIVQIKRGQSI